MIFSRTKRIAFAVAALTTNAIAFSRPLPFAAAVESRDVRSILPTTLSSADIRDALVQDFIDRATFSARVTNARFLDEIDEVTRLAIAGQIDPATAELRLLNILHDIGYEPTREDAGTIRDLSSHERLQLIIRTNAQMAQGYGQWIQGQTPGGLDAFPAQELFRLQRRRVERGSTKSTIGWPQRWTDAGGTIYQDVDRNGQPIGRMIARKDDQVWIRLGTMWNDSLGNPYPPFAFNSGMWVKGVSRKEAMRLGIIDRDTQISPQSKGFNDDLRFPAQVRSEALLQALLESLGPDYDILDGVLTSR
jgi:hypothetical protein